MHASLRRAAGALLCWAAWAAVPAHAGGGAADDASAKDLAAGEALYLHGRRGDRSPLVARRSGGLVLAGAEAACVNCHRRSALGGNEGRSHIPAITAESLLQAMPPGKGPSASGAGRPPYAEDTLLRALVSGADPAGRVLDYLMPRYELRPQDARALLHYLRVLPLAGSRFAEGDELHFATVIAPGAQERDSRAMLEVLQACFAEHGAGPKAEGGRRKLAAQMSVRAHRPWRLHVWKLHGAETQWEAQLAQYAGRQPVFALVGGLGAAAWMPVHRFCERTRLPCLFPHLEVPVDQPADFYPLYLSRGQLLEAGLIAEHLARAPVARVVQVLRASDGSARKAAEALQRSLAPAAGHRIIALAEGADVATGLPQDMGARDALVLWLRPVDLRRLDPRAAPPAQVFISATLVGADDMPLPAAWKSNALMAYPFELPQLRAASVQRLQDWLRDKAIAPANLRIQADAHQACTALRAAMQDAQAHLGREYLVEKLEANLERWPAVGLYPRLALGAGQRFASKTGYLVRSDPLTGGLAAVGQRSAP